jgi:hypothetical protein
VTARGKSALLWGGVGALSFLVLHQGYLLAGGRFLGLAPVAAVAVLVFAGTTALTYLTQGRLEPPETEEAGDPSELDEWVWGGETTESSEPERQVEEEIREERLKAKERLPDRSRDESE